MSITTAAEQQIFQSVKRVCYAGLDSVTLRVEVARRVERIVPTDENHFWTLDPDTGLISHGVARNPTPQLVNEFVGHHYPDDEATAVIDQARARAVIRSGGGPELWALMRQAGIQQDMRALFFTPEACWGSWCMLRAAGPKFTAREARFIERIAPHVAEGLKGAALLELATRQSDAIDDVESDHPSTGGVPGFLVVTPNSDVAIRTPIVGVYLDDLGPEDDARDERLPFAVLSICGRLRRRRHLADDSSAGVNLRARGRSGSWYVLHAALSEPDANGQCSIIVTIEPLARRDVAPFLFRLYGLSPREREVIVWVVRGEPTKRIAQLLGLSTHTVQDYLDKACEKIGVRGRKALVAKLFHDGFAPGLTA